MIRFLKPFLKRPLTSFVGRRFFCSSDVDVPFSYADVLSDEGEVIGLDNNEDRQDLAHHLELLNHYQLRAASQQNVFLVQPFIRKLEPEFKMDSDPNLMLEESKALVDTLGWKISGYDIVGLNHLGKREFFGSGKIDELAAKVKGFPDTSAMFISSYKISSTQRVNLEYCFGLPVFDRYNIVLQIFQRHARTKEAKLQVALAELPYLKLRLSDDMIIENEMKHSKQRKGREFFEKNLMALKRREKKLKESLEKLKMNRAKIRHSRLKNKISTVAIVGYTNCGKTTLIKAFTQSDKLQPQDKLFATLDVTVHETKLKPSNTKALLVDTVGFLSNIPTNLIASFSATLEDAAMADLIVHVRDVSHPDTEAQNENVLQTLKRLKVPTNLLDNMVVIGNKIDKLKPEKWAELKNIRDLIPTSATEGYGMEILMKILDKKLMLVTERKPMTFRVRTSSKEDLWLRKNVAIVDVEVDSKNSNYTLISVNMMDSEVEQFKKACR